MGGHGEDYLVSLQRALEDIRPTIVVPFLNGPRLGRVRRYVLQLRTFLQHLGQRDGYRTVVISHSPEFRDIALFWLATKMRRRSDAVGLFLFRRRSDGIVGRDNWRARVLEWIVPGLIRSGWIYPVSDSRSALTGWTAATGATGTLITVPRPLGYSAPHPRPTGGPVVGLIGRLRIEKGARAYDVVIREALRIDEAATVKVQLSDEVEGEVARIADRLRQDWAAEPRVEMVTGHLKPEAYTDLIGSTDVVVLPYEVATYGGGTSGVLHDTLALGRLVLATRIEWAEEAFAGRDDVIWLQGTDAPAIHAGLRAAFRQAIARRASGEMRPPSDTFARDWQGAIREAASIRIERRLRGG